MVERSSRVIGDMLATPLYEFEHESTASTVALVGTVHLGTPEYYQNLQHYIDTREADGSVTHYEGIRKVDDNVLRAVVPGLVDDVVRIRQTAGSLDPVARELGLIHQSDGIVHRETWENHDIDELELARLLGSKAVHKIARSGANVEELSDMNEALRRRILLLSFRMTPTLDVLRDMLPDSHIKRTVVNHRNGVALNAVADQIAADPNSHITMLWGGGHIPDLHAGLEAMNYRSGPARWVGAFAVKGQTRF